MLGCKNKWNKGITCVVYNFSDVFMGNGELLKEGDTGYRPKLAVTLQKIADNPEAFYDRNDQLAKDIAADIQDAGEHVNCYKPGS